MSLETPETQTNAVQFNMDKPFNNLNSSTTPSEARVSVRYSFAEKDAWNCGTIGATFGRENKIYT